MSVDETSLVRALRDRELSMKARIKAADELGESNIELALKTVIEVAENPKEDRETLREMGAELGRLASRSRYLTEFEMRDLAGVAYDAYCEELN